MNSFTRDLLIWIEKNLDQKISLEDVSVRAGYSKWYLQRLFRAETGLTLASYIRQRKLYRAAIMLKMTSLSVIEIVDRLGFSTQQTFTRTFKRHFGLAPGRYRESELWDFDGLLPEFTGEYPVLPSPQRIMASLHTLPGISLSYNCNSTDLGNVRLHTEQRQALFRIAGKMPNDVFPISFAAMCEPSSSNAEQINFSLTFAKVIPEGHTSSDGAAAFLRFPFQGTPEQLTEMQVNIYDHIMPLRREARRAGHDFFICESKVEPYKGELSFRGGYYIPVTDKKAQIDC
ncbi:helix-turn-helix domain-containing protein [Citrobacter freundii]|uniref:helix-turn-helix domain-containing protein n=1 Tax=Citrobacter freundii TaxID=546 RepID=UPI00209C038B|nr:helix-turn-helix domain-containing protein [Citrobacter freundii]